jgi:hypothetical protein
LICFCWSLVSWMVTLLSFIWFPRFRFFELHHRGPNCDLVLLKYDCLVPGATLNRSFLAPIEDGIAGGYPIEFFFRETTRCGDGSHFGESKESLIH